MAKPLSRIIKDLIDKQTTSAVGVSNLLGSPAIMPLEEGITRYSEWRVYTTNAVDMMAPAAIINQISATELYTSPTIVATNGTLTHTSDAAGLTMFSTLVVAPRSFTFDIIATGKAHNIGIYADEMLLRTSSGRVKYSITVPDGITPLNVVFVGPAEQLKIELPDDVMTVIASYIPLTPRWRDPIPIETNYVDPKSGSTGNSLFWEGQSKVGGWGIYRLTSTTYGSIASASIKDGSYLIRTDSSDVPSVPSVVEANDEVVGTVREAHFNEQDSQLVLYIDAAMEYVDPDTLSGTALNVLYFNHLHDLLYFSADSGVSYVDVNVQAGTEYSYVLDAFAAFDRSLRSNKTDIKTVTAGDTTPPGSISNISTTVINNQLFVDYQTPTDEDYLGTHVYYDNVSSGTVDSIIVDYGQADTQDSLSFRLVNSGTYFLVTFDQVGNEQATVSGESIIWDGESQFVGPNQPPVVQVRQLTSADTLADGYLPWYVARYELDASDPDTDQAALTLSYRREEDVDWQNVNGASLPIKVNVVKSNKDNWLRVRAYDGVLYSGELTFLSDFDTNPEISSVYSRMLLDSGAVYINGAVDDDTKSLEWYITDDYTGPIGSDPSSGSPASLNNLLTNKTFSFSFNLTDGQRKVLQIDPYAADSGTGDLGLSYNETFVRPPRTHAFTVERTQGGSVDRASTLVSLRPSPENAVIYYKVDPVEWGDVTSGTNSTFSDTSKVWGADYFNDTHEASIVAGVGQGQVRNITDTDTYLITISPVWDTNPDETSDYHIRHRWREIWDTGTVTSATNDTLTDSTKSWMDNAFISRTVEILTGNGAGQTREVSDSTGDTLTVSTNWTTNPSNGDEYKVSGTITVPKDSSKTKTLYFYADVPGIATEEERSMIIDTDALPEIGALTLSEPAANTLRIKIGSLDEDTKYWAAYAAKDGWPTLDSGTFDSTPDEAFKRFELPATTNTVEFTAFTGTWFVIVVPIDSYNNTGPIVYDSITIAGTPAEAASLSNLRVVTQEWPALPGAYFNRITWEHTDSADKPGGGNGDHTIKVYGYRSDRGPGDESEITDPATRYTWQDSEDNDEWQNESAALESANTYPNQGSLLHRVYLYGGQYRYMTWYYRIELYSGAGLLDEYNTYKNHNYELYPFDPGDPPLKT
jgi:hypothetical protein